MCYTSVFLFSAAIAAGAPGKPASGPATKPAPKPSAHQEILKQLPKAFAHVVEPIRGGRIDWTTGELLASGQAKARADAARPEAMARRGARLVAARNVMLMLAGVRIGPDGRPANVKSGTLAVDAVLKNFREVSSRYDTKTRTATVTLAVPLYGINGVVTVRGLIAARPRRRWNRVGAAGAGKADVVVIDARRCGFIPAASLRIVTETGHTVFSLHDVKAARRTAQPPAVYVYRKASGFNPDAANPYIRAVGRAKQITEQAGSPDKGLRKLLAGKFKQPLILTASPPKKAVAGTVVIGPGAQKLLMLHGEARKLLVDGRLIVVTDTRSDKK